jgi:carboxyl-terminal processing protease
MARRFAFVSAAVLIAALASLSLASSAQDTTGQVEKIFTRIEENKGSALWDDVRALRETGREGLDAVRSGLTRADANVRIAAGATLYGAEARTEGLDALAKIYAGTAPQAVRVRAAQAAAQVIDADAKLKPDQRAPLVERFIKEAGESDEDLVKVHLCRAAYALNQSIAPRRAVRDLFEKTTRADVKDEAALALAQMNVFQGTKGHLAKMAEMPGENGRLARSFLKINELDRELERRAAPVADTSKYELLDEILKKLHDHYHDKTKVNEEKLIEGAARGMLGSLDAYTAYYDKKAIDDLKKEALGGHYGGIGARVQMRRNASGSTWLTITEPIFSGPAYRMGLRSNDMIIEVEGESTANRDVQELVSKLRGKPGTEVTFKVFRRGWPKEREFKIKREEVQLETTMSHLLPGSIGYVNYTTFGDLDEEKDLKGSNIETQIKDLNSKGMKALILDLRNNSGGYLRTARQIGSMFLPAGKVIVTTKAQGKEVERHVAGERSVKVDVPVIVLVNEFSASASEILAGALQDHQRAVIVGERTFGKGSVQDLKYLESRDSQAAARITIAKWYLPFGKTVEAEPTEDRKEGDEEGLPPARVRGKPAGGVDPDIKVTFPERDLWKDAEFEKLRAEGKVEDYVNKNFADHKATFEALAETDYGDASKYPGFADLYASLGTKASREDVRELVREFVRKRVQDERKRAFYFDFQADVQLQRAILEACKKTGVEAKSIREYGQFASAAK